MDKQELTDHIKAIMDEEGYMTCKNRITKTGRKSQRKHINAIATALGVEKLSVAEVDGLGWG